MENKPKFKCIDVEGWNKGMDNNTDSYGRRCFTYAEDWAVLMEERITGGEGVDKCADEASHQADTDGITGYIYMEQP